MENAYFVEITDTFSGEANYSWVIRYIIRANTERGAIQRLTRHYSAGWRKDWSTGDCTRYNLEGAAVCLFISAIDEEEVDRFIGQYRSIQII